MRMFPGSATLSRSFSSLLSFVPDPWRWLAFQASERARKQVECGMETFPFHPRWKTDSPHWRSAFSNYRVKSVQGFRPLAAPLGSDRSRFCAELFHRTFGLGPGANRIYAFPFRIFRDRSRDCFARYRAKLAGTITYGRWCQ